MNDIWNNNCCMGGESEISTDNIVVNSNNIFSAVDKIQAAIFDVDGTLLDSMPVWDDLGERYLASMGISTGERLCDVLHAMSLEQSAAYLKEKYQLDKPILQIIKEILKIVSDFYRFEVSLKPGVKKTLECFSAKRIRMAIATSGSRDLVEAALERTGILKYFEKIYTCTEVGAGKDEPAVYLKTAEFLQTKPENILVFEDAVHAAETAKQTGFIVVGVYDDSNRKHITRMKRLCDFWCNNMEQVLQYM